MRFVVLGVCLAAFAGAAVAQTAPPAPPVLDQVYACAQVSGETERLSCYDAAVGRLRQAQQSGDIVAVDRQQADTIRRESFGFSLPSLPRMFGDNEAAEANATLQATVERLSVAGDGRAAFHLSNGQTWVQIEPGRVRNVRQGTNVTIRHAALGSFMLVPEGANTSLRVRRQE